MSTRAGEILREAAEAVDGPRNVAHGDKERSFECIAQFWRVYLDHRHGASLGILSGGDVASMMILLKIGRSLYGEPVTDHFMDMAGYAAIAGELAEAGRRPAEEEEDGPFTRYPFVTVPSDAQSEASKAIFGKSGTIEISSDDDGKSFTFFGDPEGAKALTADWMTPEQCEQKYGGQGRQGG